MVEIERREFLEGAYLRVSFLLFRNKMPLHDSTNTQTRSPRRVVKDVLGRRSRDRDEGLSTLTPITDEDLSKKEEEETKMTSNDWTIYILKCRQRKWYVGKTQNVRGRVLQHFGSNGSAWTREYPPTKVHERHRNCTARDEDKYTKEMMDKYGIDNVRGGSYCQIELDEHQRETLMREEIATHDRCLTCGRFGHFAAQCPYEISSEEEEDFGYTVCDCGDEFESERAFRRHERDCYYCSRDYRNSRNNNFILMDNTPHANRAHIFDTGARRCLCGEDISSRPANHTQCLACYRHSQNNSESESEESVSEDEEYERECRSCRVDISNRPLNFTQCLDCWRGGRGGRSNNNFFVRFS